MNEELEPGQVWEWTIGDDPYNIHELYLLLRRSDMRPGFWSLNDYDLWEALNLETGEIDLVTPLLTAGFWEML